MSLWDDVRGNLTAFGDAERESVSVTRSESGSIKITKTVGRDRTTIDIETPPDTDIDNFKLKLASDQAQRVATRSRRWPTTSNDPDDFWSTGDLPERRREPGRLSSGLLSAAMHWLPTGSRARYFEEWRAELYDIPRRKRWGYVVRLFFRAKETGRAIEWSPADGIERQRPW